jgi:hypothetical protein
MAVAQWGGVGIGAEGVALAGSHDGSWGSQRGAHVGGVLGGSGEGVVEGEPTERLRGGACEGWRRVRAGTRGVGA